MSVETDLTAWATAHAPLTALLGTAPMRWYTDVLRDGSALPAVVFQRISAVHSHDLDGDAGIVAHRIQLTVHAADRAGCRAVADILVAGLKSYAGPMGVGSVLNDRDSYDPTARRPLTYLDIEIST